MALDDLRDLPLEAIALLTRAAVHERCGEETLKSIFNDPRDVNTLAAAGLPAMSIFRASEKTAAQSSLGVADVVLIRFEYMLPATGLEQRKTRWPVFTHAWHAITRTLFRGSHPHVDNGAKVLDAAGLKRAIDRNAASYETMFADRGGQTFPLLIGLITAEFEDVTDGTQASDLYKFLGTRNAFDFNRTDATRDTPFQPGTSLGEGREITTVEGHPDGLPEPEPDEDP